MVAMPTKPVSKRRTTGAGLWLNGLTMAAQGSRPVWVTQWHHLNNIFRLRSIYDPAELQHKTTTAPCSTTSPVSGSLRRCCLCRQCIVYSTKFTGGEQRRNLFVGDAYTVNDGNGGTNYAVTTVNDTTGAIVSGPFSKFILAVAGGNTIVAGASFLFTVQASDQFGNPASNYVGPSSVTTSMSPPDPQGDFPISGSLLGGGSGFFLGTLATAGSYTLTANVGAFSASATVTVVPSYATSFAVVAPAAAPNGFAHGRNGHGSTDRTLATWLPAITAHS